MRSFITLTLLSMVMILASCKKDAADETAKFSINNTSWQVSMTVTGNVLPQNIFEFNNNGTAFIWRPAGSTVTYTGTWSQSGTTVQFTFKETTTGGDYWWDNTGTLSSDGTTITGTMQRRGRDGSGTFTAKK